MVLPLLEFKIPTLTGHARIVRPSATKKRLSSFFDRFVVHLTVLCCVTWFPACRVATKSWQPTLPVRWVAVAGIDWNLFDEQRELKRVLKQHAIEMELEGSRRYDVLVPQMQANLALELLRTNHLVIEGKVRLHESPK